MTPAARRATKSVASFIAGWAMAVIIWSVASGEPLRIIPGDGKLFGSLIIAFAIGVLARYFIGSRSEAARNG